MDGTETPSSVFAADVYAGLEAPETIDLRKRTGLETPDTTAPTRELYQVVQEKKASISGQVFGSDRGYVLPGDSNLPLDPDQLDEMMDKSHNHGSNGAASSRSGRDGMETEEDATRGSRKRKADGTSSVLRKVKDFKF